MMMKLHKPCSSSSLVFLNRYAGCREHRRCFKNVVLPLKTTTLSMHITLNRSSSSLSSATSSSTMSVVQHRLLGPPEIYQTICPLPTQEDPSSDSSSSSSSSPFIDLMVANFNNYGKDLRRTENGSPTFYTTGNPLLDFFFHVVPDTPPECLTHRLELAWNHDPLKALKLICNLRGVRGTGKSDKEGFHAAALWLHKNHPKTLARNLKSFAEFGYFKDLPDILYRLIEGLQAEKNAKEERERKRWEQYRIRGRRYWERSRPKPTVPREERILAEEKRMELVKEKARNVREEKTLAKAKKAVERYYSDPNYRFLHDCISDIFAECLISDLQLLNSGKLRKISFASKWCPSLDQSFDQSTLLCEGIARRVFPRDSYPEYENVEEAHYAYRIRDRLRKEVLVPLRKALELPEIYMCSNRWDSLPYNRVTSVAMTNYTESFMKHDEERFKKYLQSVERGEKKIAAGALLPHQRYKVKLKGFHSVFLGFSNMFISLWLKHPKI